MRTVLLEKRVLYLLITKSLFNSCRNCRLFPSETGERPGLCGDNQDSRQPAMKFLRRDRHQQRPGA
jgi:hypothetical protein